MSHGSLTGRIRIGGMENYRVTYIRERVTWHEPNTTRQKILPPGLWMRRKRMPAAICATMPRF